VRPILITVAVTAALGLSACGFGEEGISVSKGDPNYNGAVLFATRCSGCHTLAAAGTQGTGNRNVRTQGPNLDQRTETYEDALFAIQNGGFSGAIMPQNIVVGAEAEAVARFVAKYAGDEAEESPRPTPSGDTKSSGSSEEASEPEGHSENASGEAQPHGTNTSP
jgi:mono/diheme cytochrome c family protein